MESSIISPVDWMIKQSLQPLRPNDSYRHLTLLEQRQRAKGFFKRDIDDFGRDSPIFFQMDPNGESPYSSKILSLPSENVHRFF